MPTAHPTPTADARLSATFAALADPTRRAILARLAAGEASVNELAEPFDVSLPAISKHLKVLEGAGLVSRGRDAQRRPCRLEAVPLGEVAAWVERYRRFWEESFDRLEAYLREAADREHHPPLPDRLPRTAGARESVTRRNRKERTRDRKS